MPFEVLMPPLSQTLDTLVLVEWLKRTGDEIRKGEPLFLVESDKATLEVESPATGTLQAILAEPGSEVRVKTPIAHIIELGESLPAASPLRIPVATPPVTGASSDAGLDWLPPARAQRIKASPRARARAQAAGVGLAAVPASGPQGMIVERDVTAYLATLPTPPRVSPVARRMATAEGIDVAAIAQAKPGRRIQRADIVDAVAGAQKPAPAEAQFGNADAVGGGALRAALDPTRRVIAARLQASHQASVPVTLMREVDATALVELRTTILADLGDQAPRPSYTDLFALIVARCLLQHPTMNGTFDGEMLMIPEHVQLALAVDTPRGLVAPVIPGADQCSLLTLANKRVELTAAALASQLTPAQLGGGTFTLTNLGALGVDAFTPVINPPQIAILGTGRIRPAPAVFGGQLAIRQMMMLSLTFDHRVVDGAPAARFLGAVAEFVEKPFRVWY
ncbi:MAG: 2-oxo acid dehydrogenase subunit E2 [Anaerolineales bacterium]|nr:2-oxo acid dehydrogenase subunit E2 [Anaerolineales bacterium]